MNAEKKLIFSGADGTLNFGDYSLSEKEKQPDFPFSGDLYKVKTFAGITRLERNDILVYESDPGTTVRNFRVTADELSFQVEGAEDAQITIGMEENAEYEVFLDGSSLGVIPTAMGGKLVFSVELVPGKNVSVRIVRK